MSDEVKAIRQRIEETGALLAAGASLRAVHAEALYNACRTLLSALTASEARAKAAEERVGELEKRLKPFADTADSLDAENPHARTKNVTFMHPVDQDDDREEAQWPLPDDYMIVSAARYHDPQPATEFIGFQMIHLREAARTLKGSPDDTAR